MVSRLKPDPMSGAGTLQQRTTYLISLTLVKREPVEEDGGQPAKPNPQDRGAGAGVETGAAGGAGGDQDQGPEQPSRSQFHQGTTGFVRQEGCGDPEDSEGKSLCSLKDSVPGVDGEMTVGREKFLLIGNLLPPSAVHSMKAPKSPEEGVDKEETEETLVGISEERISITTMTGHTPSVSVDTGAPDTPTRSSIPVQAGQRPATLLKAHSSAVSRRDTKERSPTSSQSLDRNEGRVQNRSPGPCRASWAESEGRSRTRTGRDEVGPQEVGTRAGGRDPPRKDRLKTGSASLPGPVSLVPKPPRKGKSCTLDNSDLNNLTEDLSVGRENQMQQGQAHRTSAKDRKMLKFISGIFTKSSSASSGSSTAPPVYSIQRESSEEEAAIANSQEWTLSRSIPELRLGVLGNLRSGKSALVHRYITGSYLSQEKPDGGTHKKEVLVEGQSHLLLIREEAGPPDAQFSSWVDAIILVFSLENEASFQEVYQLFSQLNTHRSTADIPLIVVGTQDKITSTNPRVIEDIRARKLCVDVRHSVFYETCATYGLNVDRVFAEAAQRIVAQRKQAALLASCKSLPNSPSHSGLSTPGSASFPGQTSNGCQSNDYPSSLPSTPVVGRKELRGVAGGEGGSGGASGSLRNLPRRRTSLFANRRGSDTEKRAADPRGDVASGRAIKQSILWKRSGSSLNKEWKKKYVTLLNNGTLRYHSSFNDYMQNAHGKDIDLLRVTVKVPGKRPPRAVTPAGPAPGVNGVVKDGSASTSSTAGPLSADEGAGALSPQGERGVQRCPSSLSNKAFSVDAPEGSPNPPFGKDPGQSSPMTDRKRKGRKKSMNQKGDSAVGQAEAKRKMWKLKSFGSLRNINKTEEENADFIIVSSSGQTWHFEAQSLEEREAWVAAIESQILASLQSCESGRNKARRSSQSEAVALQAIRNAKGNNLCVDCEAPNPTWASLNLGALICIECSGIHRNLGTHLSRVRSLDLDDWPGELTLVLAAIGNHMANSIWEGCTQGRQKPKPNATREERESWIRAKYEQRVFVAPLPAPGLGLEEGSVAVMLLSAVTERDLPSLLLLLAHSSKEQINLQPSGGPSTSRAALHAACQLGDVVMTQLLVWYGSDVTARDPRGQTALTLARKSGSKECADILLQHGCPNEVSPTTATPSLSRRSSTASLGRTNSRRKFS